MIKLLPEYIPDDMEKVLEYASMSKPTTNQTIDKQIDT